MQADNSVGHIGCRFSELSLFQYEPNLSFRLLQSSLLINDLSRKTPVIVYNGAI